MPDSGAPGDDPIPKHEYPAWEFDEALVKNHPELHHSTDRSGLEGIWKTNCLLATHFSSLSDSEEIVLLKKPLKAALVTRFKHQIIERKRESFKTQRLIDRKGGVDSFARELACNYVDGNFMLAFTGGKDSALAEPFICSFCSHADDSPYEQENGLLSQ
jgi:hypothetical protein